MPGPVLSTLHVLTQSLGKPNGHHPHEKRGQQNLLVLRKLTAEAGLAQGHMARVCVLDHSAILLSRHRQYEAGQQVMRKRPHLSAPRVHHLPQLCPILRGQAQRLERQGLQMCLVESETGRGSLESGTTVVKTR